MASVSIFVSHINCIYIVIVCVIYILTTKNDERTIGSGTIKSHNRFSSIFYPVFVMMSYFVTVTPSIISVLLAPCLPYSSGCLILVFIHLAGSHIVWLSSPVTVLWVQTSCRTRLYIFNLKRNVS